jgi:flagellar assembly protein FliH
MLEEEALRRIRQAHAEGLKAGKEQAEADLATVSGALAQALLATGSLRAQMLQESEEDLLQLAVLIARKIIQQELSLDPGLLARMVHFSLQLASQTGEVVVRLHPQDYAVAVRSGELQRLVEAKGEVSIKEDPTIVSGGCIVETVRGNIDAGIEAQLEEVSNRLHEERNTRREETADA